MKEEGLVPRDQQLSGQCLMACAAERDSNMRGGERGWKRGLTTITPLETSTLTGVSVDVVV